MKKILKYLAIVIIMALVVIQFVNKPEKINSPVTQDDMIEVLSVNADLALMLKSACYDCHSNQPRYPWYAEIAPFSWWIADHIEEGRDELNFSEWATFSKRKRDHKLEEMIEEVEEGHMPPPKYRWMHSEARLSDEQIETLETWINSERAKIAAEEE